VDDHPWVPQERVQPAPQEKQLSQQVVLSSNYLVVWKSGEGFSKIIKLKKKGSPAKHDHPGQEFAVSMPVAQGDSCRK
jgi:hypothetical protein